MSITQLWTHTHGHPSAGWLIKTHIHHLCMDIGYCLKDQPGVMNNRDRWKEGLNDTHTHTHTHTHIYIYIYTEEEELIQVYLGLHHFKLRHPQLYVVCQKIYGKIKIKLKSFYSILHLYVTNNEVVIIFIIISCHRHGYP